MIRVGVHANAYPADGPTFAQEAERLGADAVWAPASWGGDALTPLAYVAPGSASGSLATTCTASSTTSAGCSTWCGS